MYAFIKGRCLANIEMILCGSILISWILPILQQQKWSEGRFFTRANSQVVQTGDIFSNGFLGQTKKK